MNMDRKTMELLTRLAEGMSSLLGERGEAVIHDFSDITKSLVYVSGGVTNRRAGAPITDMIFRIRSEHGDEAPDKLGYKIVTEDGKILKCSTIFIRDDRGGVVGSFGVNYDVTDFVHFAGVFADFTRFSSTTDTDKVRYAHNILETMEAVIDRVVAEYGTPTAMMNRQDRLNVVAKLEKSDVFMIKGSVPYLARLLGASPFTVYTYIKEVRRSFAAPPHSEIKDARK